MARLLAALLLLAPALAAAAPLPPRNEALLLLRVLAFDRELARRAGAEAVVAVVAVACRPGDQAGEARREAMVAALREAAREFTVRKLPTKVVPLDWGPGAAGRLEATQAAALLVVGTLGDAPAEVAAATRQAQVLSFGEVREVVPGGLSVGLVVRGSKAALLLSIMNAQAEGAAFEAPLLRQAEVLEYPNP